MTAECDAEVRVHDFADGSMAYLTCDLEAGEAHRGLNHHDGTYGIWWSRCGLDEHGHVDPDNEGMRIR